MSSRRMAAAFNCLFNSGIERIKQSPKFVKHISEYSLYIIGSAAATSVAPSTAGTAASGDAGRFLIGLGCNWSGDTVHEKPENCIRRTLQNNLQFIIIN